MRGISIGVFAAGIVALALLAPDRSQAASFRRSVPFELDKWFDISLKDGPVTIHRLRIERKTGVKGFKAAIARPTNSEFLQDVQIQIEFTNEATRDWQAKLKIVWLDSNDQIIDGYTGTEGLNDSENHEFATMLFSTLKYGLAQARKLEMEITVEPD